MRLNSDRPENPKVRLQSCGTVTYRLGRLACNVESTVLSLVQDSYCVRTLSKFFAHNCFVIPLNLRRVSGSIGVESWGQPGHVPPNNCETPMISSVIAPKYF